MIDALEAISELSLSSWEKAGVRALGNRFSDFCPSYSSRRLPANPSSLPSRVIRFYGERQAKASPGGEAPPDHHSPSAFHPPSSPSFRVKTPHFVPFVPSLW